MLKHIPVLLKEIIEVLDPHPGEFFIDGTLGGAGHTKEIIKKISPGGKLLAIDWDGDTAANGEKTLKEIIKKKSLKVETLTINENFANLKEILKRKKLPKADGLILDLGLSTIELESGKGFSFRKDEPLIMRYDGNVSALTAVRVLSEFDRNQLAEIIKTFGEERFAKRIAERIVEKRKKKPIRTTFELVEAIKDALPRGYRSKIHPATRTFLALRIFINEELGNLKAILNDLPQIVINGGRVAIISFHSLEDRPVKHHFRELVKEGRAELINKKPIIPSEEEIKNNPRSRSAKLRAIRVLRTEN